MLHRFIRKWGVMDGVDRFTNELIFLQTLTSSFRQYDTDMDGVITIHYEQFLEMVFSLKI